MKKYLYLFLLLFSFTSNAQLGVNTSPTYPEIIDWYKNMAELHEEVQLFNMGPSDYGLPIYLCVINGDTDSTKCFQKARNTTTLLINNAIHAGEPDGINACMAWIKNWIQQGKKETPVIAIIPAYNVGGMMNRSSNSRANQNGPDEYGFRGNAQNLDLNRDFIKMDSKNMFTFAKIYHALDPDVFIDTHVSNGADYQYVMTYIAAVRERVAPSISHLQHDVLIPYLTKQSDKKGFKITPYVNLIKDVPDKGFSAFNDLPRYAMGYASLFNSISFTTETHMLKPFSDRVDATLVFISETIQWAMRNAKKIEQARIQAMDWDQNRKVFEYNYQLSKKDSSMVMFHGYAYEYLQSEITGLERLKYHRNQPFSKEVPFFFKYEAQDSISIPQYFVVGSQCSDVIERLKSNQVELYRVFNADSISGLKQFKIVSTKPKSIPYEGHFLHNEVEMERVDQDNRIKPGDVIIPMNQKNRRFIMNVLVPDAPDSYFSWNFMDSYIQQKEYFSPYVFEDKAVDILKNNSALKESFELKKQSDPKFASSVWMQLYFIYKNSAFFEPTFNRLPIYFIY